MHDDRNAAPEHDLGALGEHRIVLLFACRTPRPLRPGLLELTLGQAGAAGTGPRWLDPARLQAGRERVISDKTVWEWKRYHVSPDLYPSVASILGGASETGSVPGCFSLSAHGENLIAGKYRAGDHRTGGLRLHLSHGQSDPQAVEIAVRVDEIELFPFASGWAIAAVELAIVVPGAATPAEVLLPIVRNICNERRDPVFSWADEAPTERFHVSALLRGLLAGTAAEIEDTHRIYSHVTAVVQSTSKLHDFGARLALHYSWAYAIDDESSGTFTYQPFRNLFHTMTLEGASTIIQAPTASDTGGGSPEHLQRWLHTAFRPAYFPVLLIAYHEHLALLELAQEAAIDIDFRRIGATDLARLQDLCERYLAVGLRYRPSLVSRITMHNTVFESLRKALGVPLLAHRVSDGVMEVERRLAAHELEALRTSETDRMNQVAETIVGLTGGIAGSTRTVARVQRKLEWLELIFLGVYSIEVAHIIAEYAVPHEHRLWVIFAIALVLTVPAALLLRPWHLDGKDEEDRADRDGAMRVGYIFLAMLIVAILLGFAVAFGIVHVS